MPRPPRIHLPDTWYHVFNRGARRQAVFFDEADRRAFLALVIEAVDRFEIELHAYCLMGNHYHLMVRTSLPNLGDFMKHVIGLYTKLFNLRHGFDGALFRGRYNSVMVGSDSYLVALSRYIHRNPIEAGLTVTVEDYPWSSLPDYLDLRPAPRWLCTEVTLGLAGGRPEYAEFVKASFRDVELDEFYGRERIPPLLGPPPGDDLAEAV